MSDSLEAAKEWNDAAEKFWRSTRISASREGDAAGGIFRGNGTREALGAAERGH